MPVRALIPSTRECFLARKQRLLILWGDASEDPTGHTVITPIAFIHRAVGVAKFPESFGIFLRSLIGVCVCGGGKYRGPQLRNAAVMKEQIRNHFTPCFTCRSD